MNSWGRCLELRGNGYIIVGAAHHVIGDTGFVNQGIVNNNFVFQRIQTIEAAMGGMDAEVGGRLPLLERFCPRAFIGMYTYSASQVGAATGVRGRFEAQLTERIALHASIQHDQLFRTHRVRRPGDPLWRARLSSRHSRRDLG